MSAHYTDRYYLNTLPGSQRSAAVILPLVVELCRPRSVVDVGCGTGAWLGVMIGLGVTDVLGIDGKHVNKSLLQIPSVRYLARDLSRPFAFLRTFDLAISVEVAEHLPPAAAATYVASLARLAPVVLFSAATPNQGGEGHLNERWPTYWAAKFAACGFVATDPLRERIWADERVEWWYRQNVLVFARCDRIADYPMLRPVPWDRLARVHPRSVIVPSPVADNAEFGAMSRGTGEDAWCVPVDKRRSPVLRALKRIASAVHRGGVPLLATRALPCILEVGRRLVWVRLKPMLPVAVLERIRCLREPVYPITTQAPLPPGNPLAAVIIPCFNYGRYLREAVASALAQTLDGVEVVVVDDGSTDAETRAVLDELEAEGGVRVIHQANRGLSAARNRGIRATRARYIACLDADDRLHPTYLEKGVAVLESRPDIGLAYSWVRLFGDEDSIWYAETLKPAALLRYNHIPAAAIFRREAWERVGGFDEGMLTGYEDWEFWLRLARDGYRGHVIPETLFEYRRHGSTMLHAARRHHRALANEILRRHATGLRTTKRRAPVEVCADDAFVNLRGRPPARSRKRLLAIVPWLTVGGAERVLLRITERFVSRDDWDVFICTTVPSANEWADHFTRLTPFVYHLPGLLPRRLFGSFLCALVARHHIDSVLIAGSEVGYVAAPRLRQLCPNLLMLDLLHTAGREGYARRSARADRVLDGHIVVHEGMKASLVRSREVSAEKVHVIPNGVEETLYKPDRAAGRSYLSGLGIDVRKRLVAFVGRLTVEKRPELFVRIAAALKDLRDVHWIMCGDGPEGEKVSGLVRRLDVPVQMLGRRDDVAMLLRGVDLLVLTSDYEGSPLVVVEALMSGVPVVAGAVGNVVEMIEHGVTGYVVPRGDVAAFCAVLRELLTAAGRIEALQARCRDAYPRIARKFSGARMGDAYVALFEALREDRTVTPGVRVAG